MDGYREHVGDPRTYHCMDSQHDTCGAHAWTYSSMDGQATRDERTCGHKTQDMGPVDIAELPAGRGHLSPGGTEQRPRLGDLEERT